MKKIFSLATAIALIVFFGCEGAQGPKGDTGLQGADGLQGATGQQGAQGIQGPQGLTGLQGPQGAQGLTGPAGVPCSGCVDSASIANGAVTGAKINTSSNLVIASLAFSSPRTVYVSIPGSACINRDNPATTRPSFSDYLNGIEPQSTNDTYFICPIPVIDGAVLQNINFSYKDTTSTGGFWIVAATTKLTSACVLPSPSNPTCVSDPLSSTFTDPHNVTCTLNWTIDAQHCAYSVYADITPDSSSNYSATIFHGFVAQYAVTNVQ